MSNSFALSDDEFISGSEESYEVKIIPLQQHELFFKNLQSPEIPLFHPSKQFTHKEVFEHMETKFKEEMLCVNGLNSFPLIDQTINLDKHLTKRSLQDEPNMDTWSKSSPHAGNIFSKELTVDDSSLINPNIVNDILEHLYEDNSVNQCSDCPISTSCDGHSFKKLSEITETRLQNAKCHNAEYTSMALKNPSEEAIKEITETSNNQNCIYEANSTLHGIRGTEHEVMIKKINNNDLADSLRNLDNNTKLWSSDYIHKPDAEDDLKEINISCLLPSFQKHSMNIAKDVIEKSEKITEHHAYYNYSNTDGSHTNKKIIQSNVDTGDLDQENYDFSQPLFLSPTSPSKKPDIKNTEKFLSNNIPINTLPKNGTEALLNNGEGDESDTYNNSQVIFCSPASQTGYADTNEKELKLSSYLSDKNSSLKLAKLNGNNLISELNLEENISRSTSNITVEKLKNQALEDEDNDELSDTMFPNDRKAGEYYASDHNTNLEPQVENFIAEAMPDFQGMICERESNSSTCSSPSLLRTIYCQAEELKQNTKPQCNEGNETNISVNEVKKINDSQKMSSELPSSSFETEKHITEKNGFQLRLTADKTFASYQNLNTQQYSINLEEKIIVPTFAENIISHPPVNNTPQKFYKNNNPSVVSNTEYERNSVAVQEAETNTDIYEKHITSSDIAELNSLRLKRNYKEAFSNQNYRTEKLNYSKQINNNLDSNESICPIRDSDTGNSIVEHEVKKLKFERKSFFKTGESRCTTRFIPPWKSNDTCENEFEKENSVKVSNITEMEKKKSLPKSQKVVSELDHKDVDEVRQRPEENSGNIQEVDGDPQNDSTLLEEVSLQNAEHRNSAVNIDVIPVGKEITLKALKESVDTIRHNNVSNIAMKECIIKETEQITLEEKGDDKIVINLEDEEKMEEQTINEGNLSLTPSQNMLIFKMQHDRTSSKSIKEMQNSEENLKPKSPISRELAKKNAKQILEENEINHVDCSGNMKDTPSNLNPINKTEKNVATVSFTKCKQRSTTTKNKPKNPVRNVSSYRQCDTNNDKQSQKFSRRKQKYNTSTDLIKMSLNKISKSAENSNMSLRNKLNSNRRKKNFETYNYNRRDKTIENEKALLNKVELKLFSLEKKLANERTGKRYASKAYSILKQMEPVLQKIEMHYSDLELKGEKEMDIIVERTKYLKIILKTLLLKAEHISADENKEIRRNIPEPTSSISLQEVSTESPTKYMNKFRSTILHLSDKSQPQEEYLKSDNHDRSPSTVEETDVEETGSQNIRSIFLLKTNSHAETTVVNEQKIPSRVSKPQEMPLIPSDISRRKIKALVSLNEKNEIINSEKQREKLNETILNEENVSNHEQAEELHVFQSTQLTKYTKDLSSDVSALSGKTLSLDDIDKNGKVVAFHDAKFSQPINLQRNYREILVHVPESKSENSRRKETSEQRKRLSSMNCEDNNSVSVVTAQNFALVDAENIVNTEAWQKTSRIPNAGINQVTLNNIGMVNYKAMNSMSISRWNTADEKGSSEYSVTEAHSRLTKSDDQRTLSDTISSYSSSTFPKETFMNSKPMSSIKSLNTSSIKTFNERKEVNKLISQDFIPLGNAKSNTKTNQNLNKKRTSISQLIRSGLLKPEFNIFSVHTSEKIHFGSLDCDGRIISDNGTVYNHPLQWCKDIPNFTTPDKKVTKQMCWERIYYQGRALSYYQNIYQGLNDQDSSLAVKEATSIVEVTPGSMIHQGNLLVDNAAQMTAPIVLNLSKMKLLLIGDNEVGPNISNERDQWDDIDKWKL